MRRYGVLLIALVACGDAEKKGRPLGSLCSADPDCREGACLLGQCLDPAGDEDQDGLINTVELGLGTDLHDRDSDGDGLPDASEVSAAFAAIDADGDGRHDALESALADSDHDCVDDQRDPDVTAPADLLARVCAQIGVCAEATLSVTCDAEGAKGPSCDYGAVAGYEILETSCDARDNDCDGATDEALAPCGPDPVVLDAITVTPAEPVTPLGVPLQFSARGHYSDGRTAELGDVAWRSTSEAVATIDHTGLATPIAVGRTTIEASVGALRGTAELSVGAAVPVALAITPDAPRAAYGEPLQLRAIATSSDGSEADLSASVSWLSRDPDIADVDQDGVIEPRLPGVVDIDVSLGALTASVTVRVVIAHQPFAAAWAVRAAQVDPRGRATVVASPMRAVRVDAGAAGMVFAQPPLSIGHEL